MSDRFANLLKVLIVVVTLGLLFYWLFYRPALRRAEATGTKIETQKTRFTLDAN